MTTAGSLVGSWLLTRWDFTVDGVPRGYPMGEDAQGQIIYGTDGHMSAILMMRDRPRSEAPHFHQASAQERELAALGYVSYGGTWELRGNLVVHHVSFALFPNWIGTDLVREVSWDGDNLVLTAQPRGLALRQDGGESTILAPGGCSFRDRRTPCVLSNPLKSDGGWTVSE